MLKRNNVTFSCNPLLIWLLKSTKITCKNSAKCLMNYNWVIISISNNFVFVCKICFIILCGVIHKLLEQDFGCFWPLLPWMFTFTTKQEHFFEIFDPYTSPGCSRSLWLTPLIKHNFPYECILIPYLIHAWILKSQFRIRQFVWDKNTKWNASKFFILIEKENPCSFLFFFSSKSTFLTYECPGLYLISLAFPIVLLIYALHNVSDCLSNPKNA